MDSTPVSSSAIGGGIGGGIGTPPAAKCKPNDDDASPPTTSPSADDLLDLSKQMERINQTLDAALRSQGDSRSRARRPCQTCSMASTALLQLQAQVHQAMHKMDQMREKGGMAMEPRVVSPISVASSFFDEDEGAVGLTAGERVPQSAEEMRKNNVGSVQKNAVPPKPPQKSFKELMAERKKSKGREKSAGATTGGAAKGTKVETLEELIASCAHCLTGSPAEYAEWLRGENVTTIHDLAKMVEEKPGTLVVGNGTVGMWKKRQFCEAVRAAASS